tara:strand:- start:1322 stop:1507 length:186 start_codon:yes stop_codon:yes gene_type:complete
MKDIKLADPYRIMTIRMCEKHFKKYRPQLDRAMAGGTSYSFNDTQKRGCELCKKEKENESR